jgi:acetyltransferase-like isoleucine patch superfamily enzyme
MKAQVITTGNIVDWEMDNPVTGWGYVGDAKIHISEIRIWSKYIDSNVRIYESHKFGYMVRIDEGFHCTTQLTLGDYVHISPFVTCVGGKNSSFEAKGFNNIMAGARIICASDRFDGSGLFGALIPDHFKGTQINSPVVMDWLSNLGTNAVMMPGSRLAKGALLTVGSVLFGETEEWGVYKGNPAILTKKIDGSKLIEYAKKLGYEL